MGPWLLAGPGSALLLQAAGFLLLQLPAAGAPEVCPASGGPGCSSLDAFTSKDRQCVKWRQTAGCTPSGKRESHGDLPCATEIQSGSSGYCECANGRYARKVSCGHRPFTCAEACQQVARYVCIGWRQTGGCSADGDREPHMDKSCDEAIDSKASGYCECGDGRMVRKPGCEHGMHADAFRCRDECEKEADLYEELGLDSSASDKTIKQAFRKLSLKYHPDKTRNDPTASVRFAAIREVYDIIGDPEQRGIYDAGGLQMIHEARKMQKGPTLNGEMQFSLESLYNGAELTVNFNRKVICRGCAETWTARCEQCQAGCANEVQVVHINFGHMVVQQQQEVPSKQKCRWQNAVLPVEVERGMSNGDTILFKSMGEQRPQMLPSDIQLTVREQKHEVFRRYGVDLHTEVQISLKEALLGFTRTITHLDGRKIVITITGITKPLATIRVEGEGMPHRGDPTQFGNLLVKCRIIMPEESQFSETQRLWLTENFPG